MKTIEEIFEKNKEGCPPSNDNGYCNISGNLCILEYCPIAYWQAVFMVEAGIEERERDAKN